MVCLFLVSFGIVVFLFLILVVGVGFMFFRVRRFEGLGLRDFFNLLKIINDEYL